MPTTGEPTSVTLQYGRNTRVSRGTICRWVLCSIFVAIVIAVARSRASIEAKLRFLYLQHQCLNYSAPSNQVVLEFDPALSRSLLKNSLNYRFFQFRDEPTYAWFEPNCWQQFPLCRWQPGPAFFHARISPSGHVRLVGVDMSPMNSDLWFYARVIIPAGLWSDPLRVRPSHPGTFIIRRGNCAVSVFAGQSNEADRSHFTIVLKTASKSGIIDCWLQDDDFVRFASRKSEEFQAGWFEGATVLQPEPSWLKALHPATTPTSTAQTAAANDPLAPRDLLPLGVAAPASQNASPRTHRSR